MYFVPLDKKQARPPSPSSTVVALRSRDGSGLFTSPSAGCDTTPDRRLGTFIAWHRVPPGGARHRLTGRARFPTQHVDRTPVFQASLCGLVASQDSGATRHPDRRTPFAIDRMAGSQAAVARAPCRFARQATTDSALRALVVDAARPLQVAAAPLAMSISCECLRPSAGVRLAKQKQSNAHLFPATPPIPDKWLSHST